MVEETETVEGQDVGNSRGKSGGSSRSSGNNKRRGPRGNSGKPNIRPKKD